MKIQTKLNKKEKYLLACSFGPDSMALFDYLIKENIYFEIAHVNYHILEQADNDEKCIRDYARKFNIKVHVLETEMPLDINEEDWARDVRYDYFGEVAITTGIKNVLVAHNEDDVIETFLLQQERNNIVSYYGLKYKLVRKKYNVIRPLLNYTKDSLLKYCLENDVPYSIDPSNYDTKFKRNFFRHNVVSRLSEAERNEILRDIDLKNHEIARILLQVDRIAGYEKITIDKKFFLKYDEEMFNYILIKMIQNKGFYVPISKGAASEIYKALKSKNANWKYQLKDDLYLFYEYGNLSIHGKQSEYFYVIDEADVPGLFTINSNAANFDLVKDKFPLIVKKANLFDSFKYDGKTLKVNRQFISWKVPLSIRDIWPGIYDKDLNLLYVPKYQKSVQDNNGLLKFNLKDIYN